ncbi:MAG TPA: hypothetical protein VI731_08215, partial [Bacteroidia bacterium]|nr:hypothetical protein [Bacteroidia bacterium]
DGNGVIIAKELRGESLGKALRTQVLNKKKQPKSGKAPKSKKPKKSKDETSTGLLPLNRRTWIG